MAEKIVTMGEIMLRLSAPGYSRFVQSQHFDVNYGGGGANVAISLSNYGFDSFFVTKLPMNEIGQSALNSLRRYGVRTDYIVRGGERLGIYFLETGASQRPSKVIYDRSASAITTLSKDELDWRRILNGVKWFHWTGITPALGETVKESLEEACKVAKESGVIVSADLNYRAKLWSTSEAQSVMIPLTKYIDVCIANEEDIEKSLGFKAGGTNVENGELNEAGYFELARNVKKEFGFKTVAITLRRSYSASRNGWSALMLDDKDCKEPYHSQEYPIEIVDRVGGGDSFSGGLIYGLMNIKNTKDALEFAVSASCLKQTIPGDFNLVSKQEVEKLAKGRGTGRIER